MTDAGFQSTLFPSALTYATLLRDESDRRKLFDVVIDSLAGFNAPLIPRLQRAALNLVREFLQDHLDEIVREIEEHGEAALKARLRLAEAHRASRAISAEAGGVVTVSGNWVQGSSGVIRIGIAGTATSQFVRIAVSGTAGLDGAFEVVLVSGFLPSVSNRFQVDDVRRPHG